MNEAILVASSIESNNDYEKISRTMYGVFTPGGTRYIGRGTIHHFKLMKNAKLNLFKKKKVFLQWFLSYLFMMGLIIVMSIMLYFYSYDIISQQSGRLNTTLLEKVRTELDGIFANARSTISALLLDSNVQKAIEVDRSFNLGEREMLSNIYTNLTHRCASTKGISHIFIYFSQGDTIISDEGHMDSQLFYDLYYQQEGLDKEAFVSWLGQEWIGDIQIVHNIKGEKEILILQNTFPRGLSHSAATLAVSISGPEILQGIEELQWDESVELLMISEDGMVIGKDALVETTGEPAEWVHEILEGRTQIQILERSYQVIRTPSLEHNFSYIALTPIEKMEQSAHRIQMFMLSGLSVCILVGIIMAYTLTSINYRPLRHIMDMFGNYDRDGADAEPNEYQWLTRQTAHFLDEHKDMRHHYLDNQKKLAGQYLYRLLTLPYDGEGKYARYLNQKKLFQKPYNLVILFCFDEESMKKLWSKDYDAELLQFIIFNIICELAGGRFDVEMVDVQDAAACIIVNTQSQDADFRENLEGLFDQLQKFISKKIKCRLSIACGSICNGLEGVYQSYLSAREALEYLEKNMEQSVVWYEDIQNPYCLYVYNLEMEQRIINTIKAGDGKNACEWIGQVIDENFDRKKMLPSVRKCLLLDLLGTVLKGAQQGESEEMILNIADGKKLFQRMSAGEAKKYFSDIILKLCDNIQEKELNNRSDKQFGTHVMKFVQENYQNPDLNVSITAMHFGLTPSYLSSLFKQQTGLNLLEYINNIRIERVKELLEEGKNLNEICLLTGFRSSGALIRVFKKGIGITPGQLKKLGKNSTMDTKKS